MNKRSLELLCQKDVCKIWREGAELRVKMTLCVAAARAAGNIVTLQHTTSSALLRVFDMQIRDREPMFTIIFYNSEALKLDFY